MAAAGCICVVCIGLDASVSCSTSRSRGGYCSLWPSRSIDSESHVRLEPFIFLCRLVAKGAEFKTEALARDLWAVGTAVNSCSASSLAVPVVEFTLSIERRDMISSRVDAFIGRIEKREESALAPRLEAKFGPLEGVEVPVPGDWE